MQKIPKTNKKSGVNRRDTQNKRSGQLAELKKLDRDDARIFDPSADTILWNSFSEHAPRFGQVNKKDNRIFNVSNMSSRGTVLTSNNAIAQFTALAFNASDIADFSNLSGVFDQYRIMSVEVWIEPQNTGVTVTNVCDLYTVLDYDDQVAPTSVSDMLAFSNVTKSPVTTSVYRKFRPHIAVAAYGSGVFAQFMNRPSEWIDAASTTAQHYGVKIGIDASSSNINVLCDVRIWSQWKNVR